MLACASQRSSTSAAAPEAAGGAFHLRLDDPPAAALPREAATLDEAPADFRDILFQLLSAPAVLRQRALRKAFAAAGPLRSPFPVQLVASQGGYCALSIAGTPGLNAPTPQIARRAGLWAASVAFRRLCLCGASPLSSPPSPYGIDEAECRTQAAEPTGRALWQGVIEGAAALGFGPVGPWLIDFDAPTGAGSARPDAQSSIGAGESAHSSVASYAGVAAMGRIRKLPAPRPLREDQSGLLLVQIGDAARSLSGSLYLALMRGGETLPAPAPDFETERRAGEFVADLMCEGLMLTAAPICRGGLGVAAAKLALATGMGARLRLDSREIAAVELFAEGSGRYLIAVDERDFDKFDDLALAHGVDFRWCGVMEGDRLSIRAAETPLVTASVAALKTLTRLA